MRYILLFASLCVCSCNNNSGLSTEAIAENNVSNLSRISIGMSQSQIASIMRKPFRQENFEYRDDTYEIWFYVTRMTAIGQSRMVPQNLTPLVFKEGTLVGWGFGYYRQLQSAMAQETGPEKKFHEEDKSLEKALEKPTTLLQKETLLSLNRPSTQEEEPEQASPSEKPYVDEKGEEMIEQENEQNFDFW